MTAREVLDKALRYRDYWGEEGGLTLSGGEPMLQSVFAAELFEAAHREGVNTCLDTAGGPFNEKDADILRLLDATDVVMLDVKAMDGEFHRRLTGADNAPVFAMAKYLSMRGRRLWIRHVMVPGLTDTKSEIAALEDLVASLGNVEKLEMLAYHEFGLPKYEALGIEYPLNSLLQSEKEINK